MKSLERGRGEEERGEKEEEEKREKEREKEKEEKEEKSKEEEEEEEEIADEVEDEEEEEDEDSEESEDSEDDEGEEDDEKRFVDKFRWAVDRLEEVKQAFERGLASASKDAKIMLERDYTWLRVKIELANPFRLVSFTVIYTKDYLEVDSYIIKLADFMAVYNRTAGVAYVKDNYGEDINFNVEPPEVNWYLSEDTIKHIAITLGHHALTGAGTPKHIVPEHLYELVKFDRDLFPSSS